MSQTPGPASPHVSAAPPRRANDLGVRIFLYGACAAMVFAALWLLGHHGCRMPWWDDYGGVTPVVIGDQMPTLGWLWESRTGHRIPLGMLMNLALLQASGWEFRTGAACSVLALGLAALGLIWVAAKVRGRPSYADAVFPLVLLSWAHWDNLIWSWMLHVVAGQVVVLSLLLLIVARRRAVPPESAVLTPGLVALLPLLGPGALAYAPTLTMWLVYLALRLRRQSPHAAGSAIVVTGCIVATLALLAIHVSVLELTEESPPGQDGAASAQRAGLGDWLGGTVRLASMALATDKVSLLAASECGTPLWVYVGTGLLSFYALAAMLLGRACWQRPAERIRAAGLLAFLAGSASLFLMLLKARGLGDGLLDSSRYGIFAMPPLFCAVYAWLLYGPPRSACVVQAALVCVVGALLPLNAAFGWRATAELSEKLQSLADDLGSGKPSYVLANHHVSRVLFVFGDPLVDETIEQHLARQLGGLRDRGVPPFDRMAPDPEADFVPLDAAAPAAAENVEWDGDRVRGQDLSSSLTFVLPRPQFVLAARLRYTLEKDPAWPSVGRAVWQYGGDEEGHAALLSLIPLYPGMPPRDGRWAWVWINDRIDRLRIHPDDGPFDFKLKELLLMVPATRKKHGE